MLVGVLSAAWVLYASGVSPAQTVPGTQPALQHVEPPPSAVVSLWPSDPPATRPYEAGDVVRVRGTPGATNVWLTRVQTPGMAAYLPASTQPTAAIVICPGGGYAGESASAEGTDIARKLAENGVAAFVLKYRLPDGRTPTASELPVPQQDVLRAMQLVRAGAGRWNLDPTRVGIMGFSAGGHLAATAATLHDQSTAIADKAGHDPASRVSARPAFTVLIYPVISMDPTVTHAGSRKSLIGETADASVEQRFSPHLHVTAHAPPQFIVHAEDDKAVPIANAHLMHDAAKKAGVPSDLVIYKTGGHGFGLGRNEETKQWFDACLGWMRAQQLIDAAK